MLHCGASEVTRDKVVEVLTPEPTDTHFPVDHDLLLTEVENNLGRNGYEIVQQAHALTQEGQRYFGLIEVRQRVPEVIEAVPGLHVANEIAHLDDPSVKPDYNLVIGLRNAHDKSFSAALAMGSRVFCCDNLGFSGEVLIGRKHTRHIHRDLPLMIPRAFAALSVERVNMETRIDAYKNETLSDVQANDLILRSIVDEKVFGVRLLKKIVDEWRNPSHDEFAPRTVWSLFNAYTEAVKPPVTIDAETGEEVRAPGNLAGLMTRTKNLHGFLDKTIGLSLKSRDEVLAEGEGEDVVVGREAARVAYN
jgi:hypothetical protein